jgi:CRP/FNR family transcriptional regulator, cyclic AMP receptor protein
MADPKLDALKRVPLFSRCSDQELRFVASKTDDLAVERGRVLTRQGEAADTFYVLLDGEAEVEIDGRPRRVLHAGDFFGEISMLDRGPATATVTTRTSARLMVMSHPQFRDAIKGNPDLLLPVLEAVAERLRADSSERLNQT